jgi:zinc/manganese transport system substrate-binding protein
VRHIAFAIGIALLLAVPVLATETVVSTHAVLGEFAQVIGGDRIDVVTIIPSGFCPAHYDLSPSDLVAVLNASLVLYSGFEPWMETLLGAVGSDATVLLLPGSWSTPEAAVAKVEAIRDALAELVPDASAQFAANADAYIAELRALAAALRERAASAGISSVAVACMEWQAEFVSWLGFDIAVTYGVPEGLSLHDLVRLAAEGRDAGAALVIDNLQSGISFGAKLAHEVGAIHVVLSNFPGAMPKTATVLDLFAENAEALFTAVEPVE